MQGKLHCTVESRFFIHLIFFLFFIFIDQDLLLKLQRFLSPSSLSNSGWTFTETVFTYRLYVHVHVVVFTLHAGQPFVHLLPDRQALKNYSIFQHTYLFSNERGIKCCKVDISSEQSNMTVVPLNWRTKHGAELVLPREYWQNTPRKFSSTTSHQIKVDKL